MEIRRINPDELYHHGIKGQRWGVRRYQNPDGSLTSAGQKKLKGYQEGQKEAVGGKIALAQSNKDRITNSYAKQIQKAQKHGDIKKVEKLNAKQAKDKRIKRLNTQIENGQKEYQVIKDMTWDDMSHEKKVRLASTGKQALATGIAAGVMSLVMPVSTPAIITSAAMSGRNFTDLDVSRDRLKRYEKKYVK